MDCISSPLQVVHLLLCPESHKLSWVLFPEPSPKPVVVLDVAVSVLKLVQCRLEHLDGTFCWHSGTIL